MLFRSICAIKYQTGHSTLQCYKTLFWVIAFYRPFLFEDWSWNGNILTPVERAFVCARTHRLVCRLDSTLLGVYIKCVCFLWGKVGGKGVGAMEKRKY